MSKSSNLKSIRRAARYSDGGIQLLSIGRADSSHTLVFLSGVYPETANTGVLLGCYLI